MPRSSIILGISAFYHDSAAALLINGEIIAAGKKNGLAETNMILLFQYMPSSMF